MAGVSSTPGKLRVGGAPVGRGRYPERPGSTDTSSSEPPATEGVRRGASANWRLPAPPLGRGGSQTSKHRADRPDFRGPHPCRLHDALRVYAHTSHADYERPRRCPPSNIRRALRRGARSAARIGWWLVIALSAYVSGLHRAAPVRRQRVRARRERGSRTRGGRAGSAPRPPASGCGAGRARADGPRRGA